MTDTKQAGCQSLGVVCRQGMAGQADAKHTRAPRPPLSVHFAPHCPPMAGDEVLWLARALQTSLRKGVRPVRLSRNASVNEAYAIWSVLSSLRTACLLSTLTASHSGLAGLEDVLRSYMERQGSSQPVSIVVHDTSEQVFVVNTSLFSQRWTDAGRRDLFYAVDGEFPSEQERVQVSGGEGANGRRRVSSFLADRRACLAI